jgi:anti-sigma B factor antagonist
VRTANFAAVVEQPFPGETGFSVERHRDGDAVVLALGGELDLETAPGLRHRLQEALAERPATVVVDLERLAFLDSTGISVLVEALKQSERQGGRLLLRRPSPAIHRVLEITGLLELFGLPPA